jgi:hypothetical protein
MYGKFLSFVTGGQSDFLVPLSHQWQNINVGPLLVAIGILSLAAALLFTGLFVYRLVRRGSFIAPLIAALVASTAAYAASSTLGNLATGSAVQGTDYFYDVQSVGSGGVKVSASMLLTYIQTGVVSSIMTTCQATGGTITTTGTISTQELLNLQSGSNYAILTGDCGKLDQLSNASNQVPTIAQAGSAGFPSGWYVDICNIGAGTQTITPSTSTIGGASTYVLAAGTAAAPQCVRIVSDGANYQLVFPPGSGATGANPTATATGTAINGSATTFMRSDAAPAINTATTGQKGLMQVGGGLSVSTGTVSVTNQITPPYYITGGTQYYLFPTGGATLGTGAAITASTTIYCEFTTPIANVTIDQVLVRVTTGVAGNGQIGIYTVSGGTLTLFDYSSAAQSVGSSASNPAFSLFNTTDALVAGTTYAVCLGASSGATFTSFVAGSTGPAVQTFGSSTIGNVISGNPIIGKSFAVAYNATPATMWGTVGSTTIALSTGTDVTTSSATVPAFAFRVH